MEGIKRCLEIGYSLDWSGYTKLCRLRKNVP